VWKYLVDPFPLVAQWTIWKVGNIRKVRLEEDTWLGVENVFRFLDFLLQAIHLVDIFSLEDAKAQMPQVRGRQGWKLAENIGLIGVNVDEWNCFIGNLVSNFIRLDDAEEDVLCWSKNPGNREYTTKLGYQACMEVKFTGKKQWWWGIL